MKSITAKPEHSKLRQLAIKAKTNHGYKLSQDMIAEIEKVEARIENYEFANRVLLQRSRDATDELSTYYKLLDTPLLTRIKWVFTGVKL